MLLVLKFPAEVVAEVLVGEDLGEPRVEARVSALDLPLEGADVSHRVRGHAFAGTLEKKAASFCMQFSKVSVPRLVPLSGDEDHVREGPEGLPDVGKDNQVLFGYVVGGIGRGKSTFLLNFLKMYLEAKAWDRVFWCSPTSGRDKKVKGTLNAFRALGVDIEYLDHFDMDHVTDVIEHHLSRHELGESYAPVYQKFRRLPSNEFGQPEIERLTGEELDLLDFFDWKPAPRYPRGKPTACLVIDDHLGDNTVFSRWMSGPLNRFVILCRHRRCSVFISSQSWTQTLPLSLRSMVNTFALYKCSNMKVKKDIAASLCDDDITPEQFIAMWDQATVGSHDCFVGLKLLPLPERYRRNLDEAFVIGSP